MRYCLNPRNPHKNVDFPIPSLRRQDDAAVPVLSVEKDMLPLELQVTCHYCRYLLEDALLGDCRVTCWVGSGAFGDVYEAEQLPPLSRRVAVKVMAIEHLSDGKGAELFKQEVRAISGLDHPNIMPVLRVGTIVDGPPYLVMKFAAHGSLQKFCAAPAIPLALAQPIDRPPPTQQPEDVSLVAQDTIASEEHSDDQTSDAPIEIDAQQTIAQETNREANAAEISSQETKDGNETMPVIASVSLDQQEDGAVEEVVPDTIHTLTPQQLLPYLEDAANALQYAHEHGIIHLDVKPANLLLDAQDRVLLADFGVSTLLDGYTHASIRGYVGTPIYTAPEQWLEQPRAASDQYALAVTCYQLLTGRPPFLGSLYTIMHGHIQLLPPSLSTLQPAITAEVEAVILHALAKDPAARFKDMRSFARAYREAVEHHANTQIAEQQTIPHQEIGIHSQPKDSADFQTRASTVVRSERHETKASSAIAERSEAAARLSTIDTTPEQYKSAVIKAPSRKKRWYLAGIIVLLLLIAGASMFSAIWIYNPCLLGICPALSVTMHEVNFVNDGTQVVGLRDIGTADLSWRIALQSGVTWLSLSNNAGTLHPGNHTAITMKSDITGLSSGEYNTVLVVTGQGIATQYITINLDVETGLSAVSITASGTDFTFEQGQLQPAAQTLTITNKSGQALTWKTTYSENTWLVVTPSQGTLKDGETAKLTASAKVQDLSPNTYLATVTFIGQLTQGDQQILKSFDMRLMIAASPATPTPTVPALQFPTYKVQAATTTNAPQTLRSGHSMVWDDHDGLLLVFGGIDNTGALLNDLWSNNTTTGAWIQLNASSTPADNGCGLLPAPRMNAAMVWDSLHQQVLLYGGLGANDRYLGDLWSYSPTSGNWKVLKCSGNAPGERTSGAVWDGHQLLLMGGMSSSGMLADFWSYIPGNGWQKLSATTPLGQRAYQTMAWDAHDSRLYVFGGLDATGQQQNDFWSYSTGNNSWLLVNPSSTANPPGRQQGMATWDSTHKVLLLTGGWKDGQSGPFYGVWAFDPVQNAWKLLTPVDANGNAIMPGRTASAIVWDATHKVAFVYAGAGDDKTQSSLNDLWMIF